MAVASSTLLGRPLWYELMTTDMKAAEAFYKTVVGWKTAPFEGAGSPTPCSIAAVMSLSAVSWPSRPR